MADNVRAHVHIRGRVQGVAFRYHTKSTALDQNVAGWVRNRADGSVEAVFEGAKDRVETVLAWCRTGPRTAVVKDMDISWETFTGEFPDFDIRFA